MKNKKSNSRPDIDVLNKFLPMSKRSNSRSESVFDLIRLPDSKRSQGHVEMIISFVLFVGVLLILFVFINPLAKTNDKGVDIERISGIIVDEMNSDVGMVSVIIKNIVLPDDYCYDVSGFADGRNFLEIQNGRKFEIYFSDKLNNNAPYQDNACPSDSFDMGVYSEKKIIIYENVENLKARYEGDYSNLKNSLGILDNFIFSFREINGNEIPDLTVSKTIPSGVNVKIKEFPVIVMNADGNFQQLILNIGVW